MSEGKLEKQIRDWAISLDFKMPDGSLPPPDFFDFLTVTPNRSKLWKDLVEKIQPKEKIKLMRIQILVSQLKKSNSKSVNKLQLLKKQKSLEDEIKERAEQNISIEKNIATKASNLLFEICKMSEMEKLCDDSKEKTLVLKLAIERDKKLIKRLDELLLRSRESCVKENFLTKSLDLKEEFAKTEDLSLNCAAAGQCQSPNECNLLKRIDDICATQMQMEKLLEEVIKSKKLFIKEFSTFLESLEAKKKSQSDKEEDKSEKAIRLSIEKVKQEITETSLQALVNEADAQLLLQEINNDLNKLNEIGTSFSQSLSFVFSKNINSTYSDVEESAMMETGKNIGLNKYHDFLEEEEKKLEEECKQAEEEVKGFDDVKEEYRKIVELLASIQEEIVDEIKKEEEQRGRIMRTKEEIVRSLGELIGNIRDVKFINEIEETFRTFKAAANQQVDLYLDIPVDALRTTQSSTGEEQFECESLQRCSNNGEVKQLFKSLLISPCRDVDSILEEIKNRKKFIQDTNKFLMERDNLCRGQQELLSSLSSLNQTFTNWDNHHNEADKILTSTKQRAEDVDRKVKFVGRVLKNWLEQPYHAMAKSLESWKERAVIKEEPNEDGE